MHQVKKWIPVKCVRPHLVRSNALTVEHRPSQLAFHTVALAGPRSSSLLACTVMVICGRTWSARSNTYSLVRSNALPAFERSPVTFQSINRTLGQFCRVLFFWASF
jgi:hypothetical protein